MKIYIASSWKNAVKVRELANLLRNYGHQVFDFTDMEYRPDGLDKFVFGAKQWAEHSGKNPDQIEYKDFLTWEPTKRAFASDKAGLDWAEVVVLLLPSGRSSHLEAGYAVGCGKALYILGDLPIGEFDAMYGFAKDCYHSGEWHRLFDALRLRKCKDCAKFIRPNWISDKVLGICQEGMFGESEASDENEDECRFFKEKEKELNKSD